MAMMMQQQAFLQTMGVPRGVQTDMEEIQKQEKLRKYEETAVRNFADKVDIAYREFKKRGYEEESAIALTIAFYKDIDVARRRAKKEASLNG